MTGFEEGQIVVDPFGNEYEIMLRGSGVYFSVLIKLLHHVENVTVKSNSQFNTEGQSNWIYNEKYAPPEAQIHSGNIRLKSEMDSETCSDGSSDLFPRHARVVCRTRPEDKSHPYWREAMDDIVGRTGEVIRCTANDVLVRFPGESTAVWNMSPDWLEILPALPSYKKGDYVRITTAPQEWQKNLSTSGDWSQLLHKQMRVVENSKGKSVWVGSLGNEFRVPLECVEAVAKNEIHPEHLLLEGGVPIRIQVDGQDAEVLGEFFDQKSANEFVSAFKTWIALYRQPDVVSISGSKQYQIRAAMHVSWYEDTLDIKQELLSPVFYSEVGAQNALQAIGEDRLKAMYKTLSSL